MTSNYGSQGKWFVINVNIRNRIISRWISTNSTGFCFHVSPWTRSISPSLLASLYYSILIVNIFSAMHSPVTYTVAPAPPSCLAIPSPRPRVPPVTRHILPVRTVIVGLSFNGDMWSNVLAAKQWLSQCLTLVTKAKDWVIDSSHLITWRTWYQLSH